MIKLPNDSATYFPAAGPQFESTYWKTKYKDFGFKWFLEGQSFFHYPYMLTNAFNNISYKTTTLHCQHSVWCINYHKDVFLPTGFGVDIDKKILIIQLALKLISV